MDFKNILKDRMILEFNHRIEAVMTLTRYAERSLLHWPIYVTGAHYISMPTVSKSGSGDLQQKNFGLSEYASIEWQNVNGSPMVALENPLFSLTRGTPKDGARYTLELTINVRFFPIQSHRNAGLAGPMPVLDLLTWDKDMNNISYFPRFSLFEFWCGQDNSKRWYPAEDEPNPFEKEKHDFWKHELRETFDEIAHVWVSFQNQIAWVRSC
jgi:hypothetical protein